MSLLPQPERERWQPLRLGLVDLFYYDQEEFAFRDGRLLLRGNNGTGKSKVLALTLPFLLDGDLAAHRIEPDADPNKRMEWNLLLAGEHPNDERLGYAWLEFGRRGNDRAAFCTIGCGMKAVKGRGIAAHWFFVTNQRLGEELRLVDSTGVALSADRLEESIGSHGGVYRRARDYRRAVDERLFGLGDLRYGALIDLLIKIRAPQLSKRPDERGLSSALTGALPPLDQALIADVAEAFRALEEDGEQLAAMVEARDAAERYLSTYRAYARTATRRRAAPMRQAQTVLERAGRELGEAEEEHARAQAALTAESERLQELRVEQTRLEARQQALQEDPAARSAGELRRASADAERATQLRQQTRQAVERVKQRSDGLRERLGESEAEAAGAASELTARQAEAADHAERARIGGIFADAVADADLEELRRRIETLSARQRAAIKRVRTLVQRCEQTHETLARARASTERLVNEQAEVAGRREDARMRFREAAAAYVRQAGTHVAAATELELPDPARAFGALDEWLESLNGANPLELEVAAAGREAARRIERAEMQTDARSAEAREALAELDQEIESLESGIHPLPSAPYTRGADTRERRAGAPFWQVVDFRDEVVSDHRAGLEAALEAAGILDGWVTPNGELLDPDTEDALLAAPVETQTGPRLSDALVPAIDGSVEVAEAHVHGLLSAIGLDESDGAVWVGSGGRFRNGVLRGAWHKPTAVFIGHMAREAARRARLAELRDLVASARADLASIEQERAALARRHDQLERELSELPSDSAARDADAALAAVETELSESARRLADARSSELQGQTAEQAAIETLNADAADLGLPPGGDELDEVEEALGRLRETLAALWPALARVERAQQACSQVLADLGVAECERAETATRLEGIEAQLAAALERRDTLQATAGAAIAELERKLGEAAEALSGNTSMQRDTEERLGEAQRAAGAAEGRLGELKNKVDAASAERVSAVEGLRRFATTGLIVVALPELEVLDPDPEWNVTRALRLARDIEQALSADPNDDARWQRLQRQVTDELGTLADALRRHGNNAAASFRDDGIVVEVTFRAHTTSLPALAAALADEVLERERLLDAREREILENHLVGEVASTLQELITAAERRVAETNSELAERPTSTGMQLRLRWTVNPGAPDGLDDARARLLRQTSDAWSEVDRAAVGGFLQNQIKAVRAADATGTWLDHLTLALDYRSWHRFTVERRQAGSWHSASGPSSSGERVLAASVPLFAAASSYYSSAGNAHAPRLVMLDEAFAGVDDRARAKCLGLLAAFDLDVVMTSEREWGCYAEVPGLAIAQLSRLDGVAAVLVTRWEWDGIARTHVESVPNPAPIAVTEPFDGPRLWDSSTAND